MNVIEISGRRGFLLSCASGLLLALAYPHPGYNLAAFIALVPLLLSLRGAARGSALARGYACGVVFFAVLLYWIVGVVHTYGGLPWPLGGLTLGLLVFYLATYVALFALLVALSWRRFGPLTLAAVPVVWVGLEIVRAKLMGGFPWGLLGYSQAANLPFMQITAIGGIYTASFLVAGVNAGIALLLAAPRRPAARAVAALLLIAAAAAWGGGLVVLREAAPAEDGAGVKVAAIQANVAQGRKWTEGEEEAIVDELVDLTRQAAGGGARLVVWPESASPWSFNRPVRRTEGGRTGIALEPHPEYFGMVKRLAAELDITLIAGSVDYRLDHGRLAATNSAFVLGGDGLLAPPYDKVHLVPFGEYVPLQRILFFVDRLVQGAIAGFVPGDRLEPLPTPLGAAATFICYEAIFPEVVRPLAVGSAYLVNITNDAWFGLSSAPEQHLAMAVVRAIETRRYLLRAANTGISAIVDPYGRIVARTAMQEQTILSGAIEPRTGETPYTRAGDLLAWACAILTLLCAALHVAAHARQRI
jgi:apolipoprotein N-acyltransferase